MSADLDSIWDLPAESASSSRSETERAISVASDAPATRPAKRPLFLPGDSDEEDAARSPRRSTPPRASAAPDDIDAMFEGLEELEDRPALDLDRVRREADARNAAAAKAKYAVSASQPQLPTKKGKERMTTGREEDEEKDENGKKKPKKVRAKLDENRLLGEFGFPQLIKDTKGFVPRGKGQEAKDLDRVMELYRMWAHRMWPKDKFKETVTRVEKLCHSRRMHNALSQFHDEAKGLVNGRQPEVDVDLTSDAEREDRSPHSSRSSSPAPASTSNPRPRVIELDDDDIFGDSAPSQSFSRAPTQDPPSSAPPSPPSSGPENYDDMDLDAILAADEAVQKDVEFLEARAPKPPPPPADDFDDDAMWDALDEAQTAKPPPPPQHKEPVHDEFDDEDMWDAVREVEATRSTATAPASKKPDSVDKRRQAEEEEMESMYA